MNVQEDVFEQIKVFLPKYLSPEETKHLYSELANFPENMNFYLRCSSLEGEFLQGDGWRGFAAINFSTKETKEVSGVILSNSCDISLVNNRYLPVNVLFAPIIRLDKYVQLLKVKGQRSQEQIDSFLSDLRRQRVTSIFYLPRWSQNSGESIVLLDDIHNHPLADFADRKRRSLFTLSQYGFYIFLLKLSIHFSRFQEGVKRF